MSTTNPPHGVDGVGQHGFIARHGLYSGEQAAAADEVAARIRELGLRTVRLVVVDQHGVPRSKSLSPEVAIAAMSNGLDFSGAIYSLDTGNQVFVPAFAAGGGFGIDELTGFPDVVLVPDRHVPGSSVGRQDRLDALDVYFSSGAPMPLDGRGLMRRALSGSPTPAMTSWPASRSSTTSSSLTPSGSCRRTPGSPRRRRRSASSSAATSTCPRYGWTASPHAGGDPRRPGRGRAAAQVHGGRVGPGQMEFSSARSAGSPRPTPWCCSGPRSSRCASAAGCWRRSCAAPRCRTSSPQAGTCTSRCSHAPTGAMRSPARTSRCRRWGASSSPGSSSTRYR